MHRLLGRRRHRRVVPARRCTGLSGGGCIEVWIPRRGDAPLRDVTNPRPAGGLRLRLSIAQSIGSRRCSTVWHRGSCRTARACASRRRTGRGGSFQLPDQVVVRAGSLHPPAGARRPSLPNDEHASRTGPIRPRVEPIEVDSGSNRPAGAIGTVPDGRLRFIS